MKVTSGRPCNQKFRSIQTRYAATIKMDEEFRMSNREREGTLAPLLIHACERPRLVMVATSSWTRSRSSVGGAFVEARTDQMFSKAPAKLPESATWNRIEPVTSMTATPMRKENPWTWLFEPYRNASCVAKSG